MMGGGRTAYIYSIRTDGSDGSAVERCGGTVLSERPLKVEQLFYSIVHSDPDIPDTVTIKDLLYTEWKIDDDGEG